MDLYLERSTSEHSVESVAELNQGGHFDALRAVPGSTQGTQKQGRTERCWILREGLKNMLWGSRDQQRNPAKGKFSGAGKDQLRPEEKSM